MSDALTRGESIAHDAFETLRAFGPDAVECVQQATTLAVVTGSGVSTYAIGSADAPTSSATVQRRTRASVETCDVHGCALVLHDSGDGESGPGEPTQECPQCLREHEPTCPQCDAHPDEGFEITSKPTRQYGGGFDTYYRCTRCGFTDVAT